MLNSASNSVKYIKANICSHQRYRYIQRKAENRTVSPLLKLPFAGRHLHASLAQYRPPAAPLAYTHLTKTREEGGGKKNQFIGVSYPTIKLIESANYLSLSLSLACSREHSIARCIKLSGALRSHICRIDRPITGPRNCLPDCALLSLSLSSFFSLLP